MNHLQLQNSYLHQQNILMSGMLAIQKSILVVLIENSIDNESISKKSKDAISKLLTNIDQIIELNLEFVNSQIKITEQHIDAVEKQYKQN